MCTVYHSDCSHSPHTPSPLPIPSSPSLSPLLLTHPHFSLSSLLLTLPHPNSHPHSSPSPLTLTLTLPHPHPSLSLTLPHPHSSHSIPPCFQCTFCPIRFLIPPSLLPPLPLLLPTTAELPLGCGAAEDASLPEGHSQGVQGDLQQPCLLDKRSSAAVAE